MVLEYHLIFYLLFPLKVTRINETAEPNPLLELCPRHRRSHTASITLSFPNPYDIDYRYRRRITDGVPVLLEGVIRGYHG